MRRVVGLLAGFVVILALTSCSTDNSASPSTTGGSSTGSAPAAASGTTVAAPPATGVGASTDPRAAHITDVVTKAKVKLE